MAELPRVITGRAFLEALGAADIIREADRISRVVIVADVGQVVRIYVERFGDGRLIDVALTLDGVEISERVRNG